MMRSKTGLGYSAASAPFGTVPRRRESIPTGAGCTGRTPAGPAPAVHTPPRWSLRAVARWACVLCALAAAPLAPAHARELIGNLEQPIGTGYSYTSSTLHIAQAFTTGSNAATLTSIDFSIAYAYITEGGLDQYVTPTVTLRRGRAHGPVVATLTGATPPHAGKRPRSYVFRTREHHARRIHDLFRGRGVPQPGHQRRCPTLARKF